MNKEQTHKEVLITLISEVYEDKEELKKVLNDTDGLAPDAIARRRKAAALISNGEMDKESAIIALQNNL